MSPRSAVLPTLPPPSKADIWKGKGEDWDLMLGEDAIELAETHAGRGEHTGQPGPLEGTDGREEGCSLHPTIDLI